MNIPTTRPSNDALDAILGQSHPVLDHGFVRVIDYMGGDAAVVQAARVSYGAGTKTVRDDEALIRYLLRNYHTTPFEMAEIKLHVKLPIFVARQWIRHRTASVNEYSARYSVVEDTSYVPSSDAVAAQSSNNKQGRGQTLSVEDASTAIDKIQNCNKEAYIAYQALLGDESSEGVARELARSVLPVSFYTQWYWKANLHNLLKFLEARLDSHAQWEIRQYAGVIAEIVAKWVPMTYKAFEDYKLNRYEMSSAAKKVVLAWLRNEKVDFESSGLSSREWEELTKEFNQA